MATSEHSRSDDELEKAQLLSELQAERGRLRLLSSHTSGIIFECDACGRLVRVWTSDSKLLAKPESDLLGRTVSDAIGPALGAFHEEAVARALSSGKGDEYEYTMDVAGGRRSFKATSVVVPTLNGSERAVVYWIRDVTEQAQIKVRALHTERLAAIGRLAAGVAHEINNPLAYISLNLEGVERRLNSLRTSSSLGTEEDFEDIASSLDMIREGSNRVQKVVRDLLNFTRLEYAHTQVDVVRAVNLALELVIAEGNEHIALRRDLGPTPFVLADEGRMIQVFVNLLRNAIESIAPKANGVLAGEVALTTRTDERGWVIVEVSDTGCGIQEKLLSKVFEPFYTTKPHAVGLGLSLCQTLVFSFSGHLEVFSKPGNGSTFRVSLPGLAESGATPSVISP